MRIVRPAWSTWVLSVVFGLLVSVVGAPAARAAGDMGFDIAEWPSVSGVAKVGATVTADPGVWVPEPSRLELQWLRNGAVVAGATGPSYVVTAADLGYKLTVKVTAYGDGVATTTASAPPTALVTSDEPMPGTITGRVTNRGGVPLTAAAVRVELSAVGADGPGQPTVRYPDQDGRYSFANVPAGSYRLLFQAVQTYEYASEWWDDEPDRSLARTITLGTDDWAVADAVMGSLGVVQGSLTGLAGRTLEPYWIKVLRVQGAEETEVTPAVGRPGGGKFRISGLHPGEYRVVFSHTGYAPGALRFTIGLDETLDRSLRLEPRSTGDLGSVAAAPVVFHGEGPSTIRIGIRVLPRVFADAKALDDAACEAASLSWRASMDVYDPRGGAFTSTVYEGSQADDGASRPDITRVFEMNAFKSLLGTHEVRVRLDSTVSYAGCGGGEPLSHSWHDTVMTGLDVLDTFTAPAPVIHGTPVKGETLTAVAGEWTPTPSTVTWTWLRDGTPIPDQTRATYQLTADDVGKRISVQVTGRRVDCVDLTADSAPTPVVKLAPWPSPPTPRITGTPRVGETLTAAPGTWSEPTPTELTYQWRRSGVAIPLATGEGYTLGAADLGKRISVTVTAGAPNTDAVTVESARTGAVASGLLVAPTPTIAGSLAVGQTLSAQAGSWTSGASLSFRWLRDGSPIKRATGTDYTLSSADAGRKISVRVTGTLPGYTTAVKTSAKSRRVMRAGTPRIAGVLAVGTTLSAGRGTWTSHVSFSYQWLRDGVEIAGATRSSYTLVPDDADRTLTVTVTGRRAGYATATRTSAQTLRVMLAGSPTVAGTLATGSLLSATPGVWTAGTSLSYQWSRSGENIPGATGPTYGLTPGDAGQRISVRVVGGQPGYATIARSGAASLRVMKAGTPSIAGTPAVGSDLKAVRGSWTSSVTFRYAWLRDGVPIPGATASSLHLTSADAGRDITVQVIGRRSGYATIARTSAAVNVP
ncbi:hypothetical protein PROP_00397 [Propionicimonas sp. T2.31MG-18]|uniref:hypothetical protein n=1 Tax=Propionicimonas sp. T2.31MG-18 TaxID=3157620 RepID=UPI0035ECEA03